MHVVFICRGAEFIGVEYLSAALKRHGHRISLVFDAALFDEKRFLEFPRLASLFSSEARVIGDVGRLRPDVVCLSVLTTSNQWARRISRGVRRFGAPVIWGGVHPSVVPDRVLDNGDCDYLVRGEGEEALPELVEALAAGDREPPVRSVSFRRGGRNVHNPVRPPVMDLDSLPMPDKELFAPHFDMSESYETITSRGCPYHCTFCCTLGKGTVVRFHSPDRVLAELHEAVRSYRPRRIMFNDDVFLINLPRLRDLLDRYKREIGIPFDCASHPLTITPETARMLKDAGCQRCQLGIQSMAEKVRREVLARQETNTQIQRALAILEDVGLGYSIDLMFDLPGEDAADQREALRFYAELDKVLKIRCIHLLYLPGTTITQYALEHGILDRSHLQQIEEGHVPTFFANLGFVNSSREAVTTLKGIEKSLKLFPLLPRYARHLLARGNHFRVMRWVPAVFIIPIDGVVGIRKGERSAYRFFSYYRRHLVRWITRHRQVSACEPGEPTRASVLPERSL